MRWVTIPTGIMFLGNLFEKIGCASHMTVGTVYGFECKLVCPGLLFAGKAQLCYVQRMGQKFAEAAVRAE